jgi:hypothetical protein
MQGKGQRKGEGEEEEEVNVINYGTIFGWIFFAQGLRQDAGILMSWI